MEAEVEGCCCKAGISQNPVSLLTGIEEEGVKGHYRAKAMPRAVGSQGGEVVPAVI